MIDNLIVLTKQGGILKPFAMLLGYIMNGIFILLDKIGIPNTGLAIIIFTIVAYALMIPLTIKQQKFSKLSAKMNPELQVIQAKYKGKSDNDSMMRMQQETQMVYKKYGVSPSGSCIQLLVQMPILLALYRVIYNMPAYVSKIGDVFKVLADKIVATDNGAFLQNSNVDTIAKTVATYGKNMTEGNMTNGVIDVLNRLSSSDLMVVADNYDLHNLTYKIGDATQNILSTYDSSMNITNIGIIDRFNTFLGLNISNSPLYTMQTEWAKTDDRNMLIIIGVLLIPILAAVTQWINAKLMPQAATNQSATDEANAMASSMKTMNTVMPIMSAVFTFSLPVGMGLYWVAGAIVRSIIQICINKHLDKIDIDAMIESNLNKLEEQRKKKGLPAERINSSATINTKNVNKSTDKKTKDISSGIDYSKNGNINKEGSLASKAFLVKKYNENNED